MSQFAETILYIFEPKIIFYISGLKFAMPPCVSDKAKDCQRTFFGNVNQKIL